MENRLKSELGADVTIKVVVGEVKNRGFWVQARCARIGREVQVAVTTGANATTRHMPNDSVAANTVKQNSST